MWQCESDDLKKVDPDYAEFCRTYCGGITIEKRQLLSDEEVADAILNDDVFGFVEASFHTPDALKADLSDFQPLFKVCVQKVDQVLF